VAPALAPSESFQQVDIDLIDPSPFQPRSRFREEALEELAQSIRSSGIVQPIVVRPVGRRFQLIAGERRWRAAQRAALSRVPAVVRDVRDEIALEMTLVENLQREDLNPVEQARAFQRLTDEFHLTQEQAAERTGKDRATIANSVRLLRLEESILDLLEEGRISAGHGRALLAISEPKQRLDLARKIARGGMTVRQVERFANRSSKIKAELPDTSVDPNTKWAVEELQRKFGTKIVLHPVRPGRPGQLAFEYYDPGDLTRLYDQLMRE
jgi:ParB family chromosome partitioning protein